MAEKNCNACEQLKDKSYDFVQNGVTSTVCNSLKNDTGFSPSNGNNDCTDLDYANDCLIGNMEDEVVDYEVCDWKDFMQKFIHNLWEMLKALICSMCGLWTNIHSLWGEVNAIKARLTALENRVTSLESTVNNIMKKVNNFEDRIKKLECYVDFLLNGDNIGAKLDESNFVAGTGVSFNRSGSSVIKPTIRINGNAYTISGSIAVDLTTQHWGRLGLTNTGARVEYSSGNYNMINTPNGNYTLCIVKIPKSDFPWLKALSSTVGSFVNAGVGQIFVQAVDGDSDSNTLPGQWGSNSSRITVKSGEIWIRVSLISLTTWGIEYGDNQGDVTFRATGLTQSNSTGIKC